MFRCSYFDGHFWYVFSILTFRTMTAGNTSSPLRNHWVFTQQQTPGGDGVGIWAMPVLSPFVSGDHIPCVSPVPLKQCASVCGSPEVWLCTFFPSSSLQSPLVFSSERDESAIYRLYWTGTTCLFSFCNVLFSSIQLHFLHALSFLIDSLIKFYSIFSPISQKAISKFIWTLCCGNIVLGS